MGSMVVSTLSKKALGWIPGTEDFLDGVYHDWCVSELPRCEGECVSVPRPSAFCHHAEMLSVAKSLSQFGLSHWNFIHFMGQWQVRSGKMHNSEISLYKYIFRIHVDFMSFEMAYEAFTIFIKYFIHLQNFFPPWKHEIIIFSLYVNVQIWINFTILSRSYPK